MPTITIDGAKCEFTPGQKILEVAKAHGVEIPHYCYHEAMSVVASCRICLVEVWAPNPRNDNKLEAIPKLIPACQTAAGDGQVVRVNTPKVLAAQRSVMEYLLINHPLDCPVCDKAGECGLQDYSYKHGSGVSRFEDAKVKQPKKDLGPDVLIYADRCIMCTRCVRFTREVSGTNELMVQGRGNQEQIDVFPGKELDNELSLNVIDICPVGALQDKSFLFKHRVWRMTATPSIDGLTSSGDNLWLEHNENQIHRVRPRENMGVNKWWTTNEIRRVDGFIHSPDRAVTARRRRFGAQSESTCAQAIDAAAAGLCAAVSRGHRVALMVSPMLSCEEAYLLSRAALAFDGAAIVGIGPVPTDGADRVYPDGAAPGDPRRFVSRAEKAPNARGVRRVLAAVLGRPALEFGAFVGALGDAKTGAAVLTSGFPTVWAPPHLAQALSRDGLFTLLLDTHDRAVADICDAYVPGATFAEKSGTFENADGLLQAFDAAIAPVEPGQPEGQTALDLLAHAAGSVGGSVGARRYDAAQVRAEMASSSPLLGVFTTGVTAPPAPAPVSSDMETVAL